MAELRSLSTPANLTINPIPAVSKCEPPEPPTGLTMRDGNGNGRKKAAPFMLVSGNLDDPDSRAIVPPHLARTGWITHEAQCAIAVYSELRKELRALKKKVSPNHVHKARVALRRWFSVWKVLRDDHWESQAYIKTIGRRLKKLQKLLGELRDTDVNIEQAEKLGCTKKFIDDMKSQRTKFATALEKFVRKQDLKDLMDQLGQYLRKRAQKITAKLPRAKAEQSAYQHIELFLLKQEIIVRDLAETAREPEEYHELRLGIKGWRYLLTEFFGVTNLELVRAQQILGQMHDLDRLTPLLLQDPSQQEALAKLRVRRQELLSQIDEMRHRLPYGLRPQITSTRAASPAGFGELRT